MPKQAAPRARKPKPADELVPKLLGVLESQRRLGGAAYPPTLARLGELCEAPGLVAEAANKKPFKDATVVTRKEGSKPALDALVILKSSLDHPGERESIAAGLLKGALEAASHPPHDRAFSAADLKKHVPTALKKEFAADAGRAANDRKLPAGVHSILCGSGKSEKRYFFLLDGAATGPAVHQHAAPTNHAPAPEHHSGAPNFARAFDEAFDRLDLRDGRRNFLKLLDLRRALPQFDRAAFDAGLHRLRMDRAFSLAPHEGLRGTLTPEERDAGISEAGNLWTYVLRLPR